MTGGDAVTGLARARAATAALWARVGTEFGWLDAATVARLGNRLLGVDIDGVRKYPAYQLGRDGDVLPVVTHLRAVAHEAGWTDKGLAQWLSGPTTYLDGLRPVDLLTDPDRVVAVAEQCLNVQW